MYWGVRWWAWAGIGLILILVTLVLARVLWSAFVRIRQLTDAIARAQEDLRGAAADIRDESDRASEHLAGLRERRWATEDPGPSTAKPFGR